MDVRSVRLSGAAVTDRTIAALAPLARLGKISLLRANVTDASIGSLLALTELEELHLDRTRITDEGLSRLREGLPGSRLAALDSSHAGQRDGGFDYGVFDWICLFLGALPEEHADAGGRPIDCDLGEGASEDEARRLKARLRSLTREKKVDFDVSDHLPIWVRLPAPE